MEKRVRVIVGVACAMLLCARASQAQTLNVTVDPTQNWIGYMNVFDLPSNGGGYEFGSAWGTSDLQASFSGATLTLAPNINCYNAGDTYWTNPDGSPNKNMAASMYVETAGYAGGPVNFSGLTLANTLVSPYTAVAFIDDFSPSYSLVNTISASLVGGQQFSINLNITPGDVLQYGFITTGPDANPATVASLGNAQVIAVPEPSSIALVLAGLSGLAMLLRKHRS
ncbi:MAG: PEP-CTERM sorting domain-containing protein [Verrucomicrobiia bacterium]